MLFDFHSFWLKDSKTSQIAFKETLQKCKTKKKKMSQESFEEPEKLEELSSQEPQSFTDAEHCEKLNSDEDSQCDSESEKIIITEGTFKSSDKKPADVKKKLFQESTNKKKEKLSGKKLLDTLTVPKISNKAETLKERVALSPPLELSLPEELSRSWLELNETLNEMGLADLGDLLTLDERQATKKIEKTKKFIEKYLKKLKENEELQRKIAELQNDLKHQKAKKKRGKETLERAMHENKSLKEENEKLKEENREKEKCQMELERERKRVEDLEIEKDRMSKRLEMDNQSLKNMLNNSSRKPERENRQSSPAPNERRTNRLRENSKGIGNQSIPTKKKNEPEQALLMKQAQETQKELEETMMENKELKEKFQRLRKVIVKFAWVKKEEFRESFEKTQGTESHVDFLEDNEGGLSEFERIPLEGMALENCTNGFEKWKEVLEEQTKNIEKAFDTMRKMKIQDGALKISKKAEISKEAEDLIEETKELMETIKSKMNMQKSDSIRETKEREKSVLVELQVLLERKRKEKRQKWVFLPFWLVLSCFWLE